ncbi:MAG: cytochrome b [Gallionella sp.]|nr:cytochrome b [Gallionella sp.]
MTQRYTLTAISLHWLMAVLLFGIFPLGIYMHDLPLSPAKLQLYSYHKWIGVTVFMLVLLRLLWRATHKPPPLPFGMPRWQEWASGAVHALLYLLMLVVPVSGWLMSSAKGFKTVWFGIVALPDLVAKDKALGEWLGEVHEVLSFTLALLIVLHVAAALKHHFLERDDVLRRMLPWGDFK